MKKVALAPFNVTVDVRDDAFVPAGQGPEAAALLDLPAAMRAALDTPRDFPPLKRALTPDDRIVIVVDDRLPGLSLLIGELLAYVGEVGIVPECITLLSPAGSRQPWVADLPDAWQDVRTEIHDPADRHRLSYLASTRQGRRVYMNRTLVDADQAIVLAGCRFDPRLGYMGGAASLFPALCDAEAIAHVGTARSLGIHGTDKSPLEHEVEEVVWLLGVPFFVQCVEGEGDGVEQLIGGTVESLPLGRTLCEQRWHVTIDRPAHTAVVTMLGDPARHDFLAVAEAAASAAHAVEPGGRIVLLTRATPQLGDGMALLRDTDSIAVAARRVQERNPPDQAAAQLWLEAAGRASLYLLSGLADEVVEELFATPLQQARQVQRLIDAAGSCVFLPDAHKMLVEVA